MTFILETTPEIKDLGNTEICFPQQGHGSLDTGRNQHFLGRDADFLFEPTAKAGTMDTHLSGNTVYGERGVGKVCFDPFHHQWRQGII